jgi:hypothetical protein
MILVKINHHFRLSKWGGRIYQSGRRMAGQIPVLKIFSFSIQRGAKVNFLNEKSNQKVLPRVYPETPDETLVVFDSDFLT